jgi:hypothetical protein
MQRADGDGAAAAGGAGSSDATVDAAAVAAAALTVAPLKELMRAADKAVERTRRTRALELRERALAAADASLPRDSLIIGKLLQLVTTSRLLLSCDQQTARGTPADGDGFDLAWRDEQTLAPSHRSLMLAHTRWRAGTLFKLSAQEQAYFDVIPRLQRFFGAEIYIHAARDAVVWWPPLRELADEEARLHAVHGALRAAQEMFNPRFICPMTGQLLASTTLAIPNVTLQELSSLLKYSLSEAAGGLLLPLRSTCALSQAEEAELRHLALEVQKSLDKCAPKVSRLHAEADAAKRELTAKDLARHGLRRCALPSCDALELHPKAYKLCGRCCGVAYCGAAHCAEDWKRHKREDGCRAAE